ncbi:MAG: Ig-like domain-containing protein [Clostridia bacterium]|nr:Ig-like domain-containing protein [Clostridia bacterium]
MKKKTLAIIISAAAMILLSAAAYIVDFIIARGYRFEVIAASAEEIVADGTSSVKIRVKLSRGGAPVEGHTVYVVASNGSLPSSRLVTDENGYITFVYYPYLYVNEKVSPLEDVTFKFQDESNSKIFMIPATGEYTMKAVKPDEAGLTEDWQGLEIRSGEE